MFRLRIAEALLRYYLSGRYLLSGVVRRAALLLLARGDDRQSALAIAAYDRLMPRVSDRIVRDVAGYVDPDLGLVPEFDPERWDGLS